MLDRLKRIVEQNDTPSGRTFDLAIQALIVLSLVTFSVETLPNLSPDTHRWLNRIEIVTVLVFSAEYLLRLALADEKLRFAFSFFGLIDLLAILPFYIASGVDLRSVRALRFLRLFRAFKIVRYSKAMRRFHRAFIIAREELVLFLIVTLMLLYFSAVGIYYFENEAQPDKFASVFHSLWWSVATLTTVGYGDIYPVTVGGKIFTFAVLMIGLGFVSVPAGLVASALSKARAMEDASDEVAEKVNPMAQVQESSHIRDLSALNRRISELEAIRTGIRPQLSAANRAVSSAGIRHAYRRLQQSLRSPAKSFELWPLGVMLAGPLLPSSLVFGLAQILSGSYAVAFGWFVLIAGISAALLACLLFVPGNSHLEMLARDSELGLRDAQGLANNLRVELSNVEHSLQTDIGSRDAILKSIQYQRELLLQQNWKAMRGPEWEAYLVDIFHLFGGIIEPTGKSGDQGVDLIVEIGTRRYAIQAKSYVSSVGNSAIQEAVAGMAHYRCNCSAVVTNSRFTAGAIALAESNCCLLIGEDQIPALVLGRLSF